MSDERKCLRCGSVNLESGHLQSFGRLYFQPTNTKFLKIDTANVPIDSAICADCGTIDLQGDLEKLKKLTT